MEISATVILGVVGFAGTLVGAYAAIRADLARAFAKAEQAEAKASQADATATRAHERIDKLLEA